MRYHGIKFKFVVETSLEITVITIDNCCINEAIADWGLVRGWSQNIYRFGVVESIAVVIPNGKVFHSIVSSVVKQWKRNLIFASSNTDRQCLLYQIRRKELCHISISKIFTHSRESKEICLRSLKLMPKAQTSEIIFEFNFIKFMFPNHTRYSEISTGFKISMISQILSNMKSSWEFFHLANFGNARKWGKPRCRQVATLKVDSSACQPCKANTFTAHPRNATSDMLPDLVFSFPEIVVYVNRTFMKIWIWLQNWFFMFLYIYCHRFCRRLKVNRRSCGKGKEGETQYQIHHSQMIEILMKGDLLCN